MNLRSTLRGYSNTVKLSILDSAHLQWRKNTAPGCLFRHLLFRFTRKLTGYRALIDGSSVPVSQCWIVQSVLQSCVWMVNFQLLPFAAIPVKGFSASVTCPIIMVQLAKRVLGAKKQPEKNPR